MTALAGVDYLVLAAGASRRMGEPKALVAFRGAPLLAAHLAAAGDAASRIVVVGEHAARIQAAHADEAICWVRNAAPRRGPFSSVIAALVEARRRGTRGCVLTPVDTPPATARVLRQLADAAVEPGVWAAVPVVHLPRGAVRGGHPVWLTAVGVTRVLGTAGAPAMLRLDHLLAAWGSHVRCVAVDDATVTRNLNSPADLLRD